MIKYIFSILLIASAFMSKAQPVTTPECSDSFSPNSLLAKHQKLIIYLI